MNQFLHVFVFIALLILFCGCASQENSIVREVSTTTSTLEELGTTDTTTELGTTTSSSTTTSTLTTTTTTSTTSTTSTTIEDLPVRERPKVSLKFDKGTYHSAETMNIVVKIDAVREMNKTKVNLLGIFAGTHFWLNKTGTFDLVNGTNNISFTYTMPLCNKCSGIAAGTYTVEAEVDYNGKPVARDIKSVSLIQ